MVDPDANESIDTLLQRVTGKLTGGDHYPFAFVDLLANHSDAEMLDLAKEDLDRPDNAASTLLCAAIESDRVELCGRLLALGCDADLSFTGLDPSECCIQSKGMGSLQLLNLIVACSKYSIRDQHADTGRTLLHQAVSFGRSDIAAYLFDRGASLDDMDIDCESVRETALAKGGAGLVCQLEALERRASQVRGRSGTDQ